MMTSGLEYVLNIQVRLTDIAEFLTRVHANAWVLKSETPTLHTEVIKGHCSWSLVLVPEFCYEFDYQSPELWQEFFDNHLPEGTSWEDAEILFKNHCYGWKIITVWEYDGDYAGGITVKPVEMNTRPHDVILKAYRDYEDCLRTFTKYTITTALE